MIFFEHNTAGMAGIICKLFLFVYVTKFNLTMLGVMFSEWTLTLENRKLYSYCLSTV